MEIDKVAIILDAANKVFVRYGYQKTSMDDIAKESMIGKGSIYYYFESKEDIFIAVLKRCATEMIKNLSAKLKKAKTFEEKFYTYFNEPHQSLMSKENPISHLWSDEPPAFLTKLSDFKNEIHEELKSLLSQVFAYGVETGRINRRYNDIIDKIVDEVHKWMVTSGDHIMKNPSSHFTQEQYASHQLFTDIFLNGLLAKDGDGEIATTK